VAANRTISARSADPFAINAKDGDEKVWMDAFTIRAGALRGGWPHPAKLIVRRSFLSDQARQRPIADHGASRLIRAQRDREMAKINSW